MFSIHSMAEIINCTRCCSKELTQEDFGFNKNGERLRTCNDCRFYTKQRKMDNKETINQQAREHYQTVKEVKIQQVKLYKIENHEKLHEKHKCACGGKFIYRKKAEHEKTIKHQRYIDKQ